MIDKGASLHDRTKAIAKAANWLATTPSAKHPRPIVPHLKAAYGLNAQQACQAIQKAALIHARAH